MLKIIKFELSGDYAHFKKFYTTSSPLTFSVPPVTALNGLIGAFLGWSKKDNEYIDKANDYNLRFALKIKQPLKKIRLGLNWIDTKVAGKYMNQIKQRTQVMCELLKDPVYIIYVSMSDEGLIERLSFNLSKQKTIYTPYLGISECLARFKFIGLRDASEQQSKKFVNIASVIPMHIALKPLFEKGKSYFRENIPVSMDNNRQVTKYKEVLLESKAKSIKVEINTSYYTIDKENIVFIN